MITFVYSHRVRYREVDPMGVVYHAHYIDYFEHARTEFLRDRGLAYKELEDAGVIMPVVDLAVQYRRPAYYDDVLDIYTHVKEAPTSRIRIDYQVRRHAEDPVLVTGHVTLCFVDRERGRPVPAPDAVQSIFADAFDQGGSGAASVRSGNESAP